MDPKLAPSSLKLALIERQEGNQVAEAVVVVAIVAAVVVIVLKIAQQL